MLISFNSISSIKHSIQLIFSLKVSKPTLTLSIILKPIKSPVINVISLVVLHIKSSLVLSTPCTSHRVV